MGIKISELTPDANISGVEIIPVSDGGAAKSVTTGGIKDFVIDSIEGLTAAPGVTNADGVYLLKGGELKPINIDHVAQYAIDKVWSQTGEDTVAGTHKLPLKDGNTEKTVTAANLAAYIRSAITAGVLNLSNLDAAVALSGGDLLLVNQGGVAKRTTLAGINAAVYAGFQSHIAGLNVATTTSSTDTLYLIQSGVGCKISLASLAATLSPLLKDELQEYGIGIGVQTVLRSSDEASDEMVATEKAVRAAMDDPTLSGFYSDGGRVVRRYGKSETEGYETVVCDRSLSIIDYTIGGKPISDGYHIITLPANSLLRSIQVNVEVKLLPRHNSNSTTLAFGLDENKSCFGVLPSIDKNTKHSLMLWELFADSTTVCAYPWASDDELGNGWFNTEGHLRVCIVYDRLVALNDAG